MARERTGSVWWENVRQVELANFRFIQDTPPPLNTPMCARYKRSYAYVTVLMRLGIIVAMTLDQFKVDMEEFIMNEIQALEEEIKKAEGKEDCKPGCSGQDNPVESGKTIPQFGTNIQWICTPAPLPLDAIEMGLNTLEIELQKDLNGRAHWVPQHCYGMRKRPSDHYVCHFGQYRSIKKPVNEKRSPDKPKEVNVEDIPPCDPRYLEKKKEQLLFFDPKQTESDDTVEEEEDPRFKEWCNVEKALMELKKEIATNRWFPKFRSDAADIKDWNQFLKEQAIKENTPKLRWLCTIWVYAECYMYRRLREIFEMTNSLKNYDPFRKMKIDLFKLKLHGMHLAAKDIVNLVNQQPLPSPEHRDTRDYLKMLLTMSLWGNRPDLTLGGPTSPVSDFTGGNPLVRALTFAPQVLCDEMDVVWPLLLDKEQNENRRVDIVTGNAGFELFADMLLADFLVTFRLADRIHFHVKAMPWQISEVTSRDVEEMIEMMAECRWESKPLAQLAERWIDFLRCGKWIVEADYFWTLPYDYNDMRCYGAPLYAHLINSSLIIFKGDLHYRKLVGDINWDPNIPFKKALRHFRPTNILALRAFKSDVACGLPEYAYLFHPDMPKGWMLAGKVAVTHFAKRRPCVLGLLHPP